MKRCSQGHNSPDEAVFCMLCGERLPSELDPILSEVTRSVQEMKTLCEKDLTFSQAEIETSLGRLGILMRRFVETKKRLLVGMPKLDQSTITSEQQIEHVFRDIPQNCKLLILTKVISNATNAAKSLKESHQIIKRTELLSRLAATLTFVGQKERGLELFFDLTRTAERSSGHVKADTFAHISQALDLTGQKDNAARALKQAIDQAKNSRDYSEKTAEMAALAGQIEEALELTKKEKTEYKRVVALARLTSSLALRGRTREASKTFDCAREIAYDMSGRFLKPKAQAELPGALVLLGRLTEATDMADRIGQENKSQQLSALENMAESLALLGQTTEAIRIVNEEFKGRERKWALARVAGAIATSGRPDKALSLSREIHDEFYLDMLVRPKLIRALALSGQIALAIEIMNIMHLHEQDSFWRKRQERANALVNMAEALSLPNAPVHEALLLY
jgi:tetratricopeptide (TPR) repeat protein